MNEPSNFNSKYLECQNQVKFPNQGFKDFLDSKTICMNARQGENGEYEHYDVHNLYGWSESEPTMKYVNVNIWAYSFHLIVCLGLYIRRPESVVLQSLDQPILLHPNSWLIGLVTTILLGNNYDSQLLECWSLVCLVFHL